MWPRDWSFVWFCGRGSLILSYHLAKFGSHRPSENENITFFICHMITRSSVPWLCGRGTLLLSYHPAKFGVHSSYKNRNITFFICHVITWLCWWGVLILSHHPVKCGGHRLYEKEDNSFYNNSSNCHSIRKSWNHDKYKWSWYFNKIAHLKLYLINNITIKFIKVFR